MHIKNTYNQLLVDYQSSFRDSILHFGLEISNTEKSMDIIDEELDIDLKGKKYLNSIYETLNERSLDSKYNSLTLKQVRQICFSLRELISQSTASLNKEELNSPNVQGMYISLAFARRILKNKLGKTPLEKKILAKKMSLGIMDGPAVPVSNVQPVYAQDVFGGYELGLSAFAMNEDIIVNKQAFLDVVNQDASALIQDDKGLYVFQTVLNSISASTFSLKDLLTEIDFYVSLHPENLGSGSGSGCPAGWWPSGSSHGCCGNYNGCCWVWNPIGYIHDKICKKCKPAWFCLSGCKPDPAHGNVEAFSFIEDSIPIEGNIFLPQPLPSPIYYKKNYEYLSAYIPQFSTEIIFNSTNSKYYSDNQYLNIVPDGYYDSPSEIFGNNHVYYLIINGVVVNKYNVTIIPN